MKSVLRWALVALTAASVVACGDSPASKETKNIRKDKVEEMTKMALELDSLDLPNVTWSEKQLTDYETLLNRLDILSEEVNKLNPKNFNNYDQMKSLIEARKTLIDEIRKEQGTEKENTKGSSGIRPQDYHALATI